VKVDLKWAFDREETSERDVAIVADILRASTTIITAFSLGAREIIPFKKIEDARKFSRQYGALLMGERNRLKPEGFDFGNTPLELNKSISGRAIAFTSTNFPTALFAATSSPHVLIGSIINASAVCDKAYVLALEGGLNICLMLAGREDEPHVEEDLAFAGICGEYLTGRCKLSEKMVQATEYAIQNSSDIHKGRHAIELCEAGFREDVEFANQKDRFNIVPAFKNGRIALWE